MALADRAMAQAQTQRQEARAVKAEGIADHDRKINEITGVLGRADSPEKWARGVQFLKARGHEFDPGEEDFANRDAILGQAMSLKEQMAQSNSDRNFDADQNYRKQQIGLEREKLNQSSRPDPKTAVAKLNSDLSQKLITPEQYQSEVRRLNAPGIGIGPGGTLQVNEPEPLPLGKAATNEVQKGAVGDLKLIEQTDNIGRLYDRKFLEYMPQLSAWKTRILSKGGVDVTPEDREFLKKKTKFDNGVERLFNSYRKEITGAAAAVQELDRLKKSFLNVDMAPIEFEASLEEYQAELKRTYRLRVKLLREGLDPNTPQGGAAFDNEYLGGADDSAQARGDEILSDNPNLSPEEVLQQLQNEGYEQ